VSRSEKKETGAVSDDGDEFTQEQDSHMKDYWPKVTRERALDSAEQLLRIDREKAEGLNDPKGHGGDGKPTESSQYRRGFSRPAETSHRGHRSAGREPIGLSLEPPM
jgi:hypothetical protein